MTLTTTVKKGNHIMQRKNTPSLHLTRSKKLVKAKVVSQSTKSNNQSHSLEGKIKAINHQALQKYGLGSPISKSGLERPKESPLNHQPLSHAHLDHGDVRHQKDVVNRSVFKKRHTKPGHTSAMRRTAMLPTRSTTAVHKTPEKAAARDEDSTQGGESSSNENQGQGSYQTCRVGFCRCCCT
jgi:hypothetical protein